MKIVIAMIVLVVAGFLFIGYGSQYVMNGIDGGMHNGQGGGGGGAFELTEYQKMRQRRQRELHGGGAAQTSYTPATVDPGDVTSNPFAQ